MEMKKVIRKVIDTAYTDANPVYFLMLKLMEEVGELSEAVNHQLGHLPHKTMKEPVAGEIADVILLAISLLPPLYPDLNQEELMEVLKDQLKLKTAKWESILNT